MTRLMPSPAHHQVKLEGLLGDAAVADLASGVISDVGPEFLEEFRPEVGAIISGQIKDFVNELLSSFTLASLIERIKKHTEDTATKRLLLRNQPHLYHHQQLQAEADRMQAELRIERRRMEIFGEHLDKTQPQPPIGLA